jgi:hypothetical protein
MATLIAAVDQDGQPRGGPREGEAMRERDWQGTRRSEARRRAPGRLIGVGAVCSAAVALALSGAGVAAAGGARVGPHQLFVGLVNGKSTGAVVTMCCPGPNVAGYALGGQTLALAPAASATPAPGDTGAAGRRIVATVGPAASTAGSVVFYRYGVSKPFPTNVLLPCVSSVAVRFTPAPTGPGARAYTERVALLNLCRSLVADVTSSATTR